MKMEILGEHLNLGLGLVDQSKFGLTNDQVYNYTVLSILHLVWKRRVSRRIIMDPIPTFTFNLTEQM